MFKEQKGVTLIALVITIIVLLILAGVSIAFLTGENGILNKSTKAAASSACPAAFPTTGAISTMPPRPAMSAASAPPKCGATASASTSALTPRPSADWTAWSSPPVSARTPPPCALPSARASSYSA